MNTSSFVFCDRKKLFLAVDLYYSSLAESARLKQNGQVLKESNYHEAVHE